MLVKIIYTNDFLKKEFGIDYNQIYTVKPEDEGYSTNQVNQTKFFLIHTTNGRCVAMYFGEVAIQDFN